MDIGDQYSTNSSNTQFSQQSHNYKVSMVIIILVKNYSSIISELFSYWISIFTFPVQTSVLGGWF